MTFGEVMDCCCVSLMRGPPDSAMFLFGPELHREREGRDSSVHMGLLAAGCCHVMLAVNEDEIDGPPVCG